ncbi:hypothetical protein H5410_016152 [Solanum commersonii]|uniref:Uncharacterized protein n=1 Tax=Solanum commersonii TaxID=4109 RepID=A0A9J5ZVT2_SOLCO|nr:hypothetical protein H5410_016152 [Solanum commersonii]
MVRKRSTNPRGRAPAPTPAPAPIPASATRAIPRGRGRGRVRGRARVATSARSGVPTTIPVSIRPKSHEDDVYVQENYQVQNEEVALISSGSQARVGGQNPDQQPTTGLQIPLSQPAAALAPRLEGVPFPAFQTMSAGGTFQRVVDAAKDVEGYSGKKFRPPSGRPIHEVIQTFEGGRSGQGSQGYSQRVFDYGGYSDHSHSTQQIMAPKTCYECGGSGHIKRDSHQHGSQGSHRVVPQPARGRGNSQIGRAGGRGGGQKAELNELNKRADDFIGRMNNQIRVAAAR